MNKDRRDLIIIWTIVFVLMIAGYIALRLYTRDVPRTDRTRPSATFSCPAGTFDTGAQACKIIPTGCPYGDSIPLDKCQAPEPYEPLPIVNSKGGK